jgi:hypothetical protein
MIDFALKAQKWIDEQESNGATRLDMQDAARGFGFQFATAILDIIGHPVDDLYRGASALVKIGNQQSNDGTFMDLPAIVNCHIEKCRHCNVEFVGWHVWRNPQQFIRPEISGRLAIKFCPACGKGW